MTTLNNDMKDVFEKARQEGKVRMLTVALARELKGKTILWTYCPSEENGADYYVTALGEIESRMSQAEKEPFEDYASRADMWRKCLSDDSIKREENTFELLSDTGENTGMYYYKTFDCFDEPTFTCSDADRPVMFIEI